MDHFNYRYFFNSRVYRKSMKYLITGGAGFIGSNIAETLSLDSNIDVIVLDDLSAGKMENLKTFYDRENITFIKGSITDPDLLLEATKNADGIFHEAAIASVQRSINEPNLTNEVNLTGTLNVLNAAEKNEVKTVVMASSAAVYGDNSNLPLNENEKPGPLSPYAVQKLSGEYYAETFSRLYGIDAICLRYFNVYGPRQDPSSPYSGVISIFTDNISSGKPLTIFGDGRQTRDFIYVGDVVRANLLAMGLELQDKRFRLDKGANSGVYNIATGTETNLLQLAEILMEIYDETVNLNFEERRDGDIRRSLADIKKAAACSEDGGFGFFARTDLRDGLLTLKDYLDPE